MDAVHQKIQCLYFLCSYLFVFLSIYGCSTPKKFNIYIFFSVNTERVNSESNGPKSDSDQDEEVIQDLQQEIEESNVRPMYALFILPLVIVFSAISIAYLKHCLQRRILNLIRLVYEYMTPSDVVDPDQTPLKVLERLDAVETDDGDLTSDLLWDDSIERNAQIIVDEATIKQR